MYDVTTCISTLCECIPDKSLWKCNRAGYSFIWIRIRVGPNLFILLQQSFITPRSPKWYFLLKSEKNWTCARALKFRSKMGIFNSCDLETYSKNNQPILQGEILSLYCEFYSERISIKSTILDSENQDLSI